MKSSTQYCYYGISALAILFVTNSAIAQSIAPAGKVNDANRENVNLSDVKPMEKTFPTAPNARSITFPAETPLMGKPAVSQGQKGSGKIETPFNDPAADTSAPRNYGSSGVSSIWQYNDRLVQPYTDNYYRTYGKLVFTQGNKTYSCTAALISPSIGVTAGHCLHMGNNTVNGYNTFARFYPSYYKSNGNTSTPYGYADANWLLVSGGWYKDGSKNSTLGKGWDVGVFVLNKARNASGQATNNELGRVVGWNSFCYGNCLQSYMSLSQYGYPGNYYSGNRMTESQHLASKGDRWQSAASGDYVAGSGMEGGSSGGPSILNPGEISDTAVKKGDLTNRNVIMAVTSWGYPDSNYKVQGYTPLSGPNNVNDFKGMFNRACDQSKVIHGTNSCTKL